MAPSDVFLGNLPGITIQSPDRPTYDSGSVLDWFFTNMDFRSDVKVTVDDEAGIIGHRPVTIEIPRSINGDLGVRLKRPVAFKGVTKAELKGFEPEPGLTIALEGTLEDKWAAWNTHAESWLAAKEEADGHEYLGRGTKLGYVKNTVSAPQFQDGVAGTGEMKDIHTKLNRINRYLYLDRTGKGDSQEARTLRSRLHHYEDYTAAAENLRAKLEECRKRVDKERRDRWLEWSKECWGTRKRAIYRWASGKTNVRAE